MDHTISPILHKNSHLVLRATLTLLHNHVLLPRGLTVCLCVQVPKGGDNMSDLCFSLARSFL